MAQRVCAARPVAPALLRTLRGHSDTVRALSVSQDGAVLYSGSWDGTVRAWRAGDGEELYALPAQGGAVLAVAQSADGELLFAGTESGDVRVWQGAKTRVLRAHVGPVRALATARREFDGTAPSDSPLYSAGDDGVIRAWTGAGHAQPQRRAELSAQQQPAGAAPPALWCLALSRDGEALYAGGEDGSIAVWQPRALAQAGCLRAHAGAVRALALSRDDASLFSAGEDRLIRRWSPGSGQVVAVLRGHNFCVLALALSRDGRTLYSGSWDHSLRVWGVEAGECVHVAGAEGAPGGSSDPVWAVALAPDSTELHSAASDCHVRTWRVAASPWAACAPKCGVRGGWAMLLQNLTGQPR